MCTPEKTEEERAAREAINTFRASGFAYFLEQSTRPQTVGYATLDSPVALAAWMLDHDTDSYYKISRAFLGGPPAGNLTRRHILDNITLYWLTNTGVSSARLYWENKLPFFVPKQVSIPVAVSAFADELYQCPRS